MTKAHLIVQFLQVLQEHRVTQEYFTKMEAALSEWCKQHGTFPIHQMFMSEDPYNWLYGAFDWCDQKLYLTDQDAALTGARMWSDVNKDWVKFLKQNGVMEGREV